MTYAERNLLKGRTGSFCLTIPIIHGTAREGIAAVPQNIPIIQVEPTARGFQLAKVNPNSHFRARI